jgi:hypothetical protein
MGKGGKALKGMQPPATPASPRSGMGDRESWQQVDFIDHWRSPIFYSTASIIVSPSYQRSCGRNTMAQIYPLDVAHDRRGPFFANIAPKFRNFKFIFHGWFVFALLFCVSRPSL